VGTRAAAGIPVRGDSGVRSVAERLAVGDAGPTPCFAMAAWEPVAGPPFTPERKPKRVGSALFVGPVAAVDAAEPPTALQAGPGEHSWGSAAWPSTPAESATEFSWFTETDARGGGMTEDARTLCIPSFLQCRVCAGSIQEYT